MRLALDDDRSIEEGVPVIDAVCFIMPIASIDPWSSLCVRLCRPMDPPAKTVKGNFVCKVIGRRRCPPVGLYWGGCVCKGGQRQRRV